MRRPFASLALVVGGLLVAVPVLASQVAPKFVSGAESCAPLTPGTVELVVELPQGVGTATKDNFSVDVNLNGSVGNGSVTFSKATLPIKSAFVAGQTGGNLYAYQQPVKADSGLVAPNGEPIKRVSFCYVAAAASSGSPNGAAGGAASAPATGGVHPATSAPQTDTQGTGRPARVGWIVLLVTGLALFSSGLLLALLPAPTDPRRRR